MRFRYLLVFLFIFLAFTAPSKGQEKKDQEIIRVGLYENPPKIFTNKEGDPDGIFIDLLEVISEKEELQVEYVSSDWNRLLEMLSRGEIDVLPDMAYSQERDSLFVFNNVPVLSSWLEVFSLEPSRIQSITDLEHKKVGVLKGSVQEEYLEQYLKSTFDLRYQVLAYSDYKSSVQALENAEIDLLIASRFFYFSEPDSNVVSTGIIMRPSELYFAFPKNVDPFLVKRIDTHLSKFKNDPNSDYYQILHHWFAPPQDTGLSGYLWWIIGILLILLGVIGGFILLLRHQVKLKTKALWKRNRQLSRAKEKAEKSERLKTIFLQNMSHEIRTPMNGIIGFLELLKDPETDPETRRKYINIVIKSGKRLQTTINNIIEISKIDTDQITVQMEQVDIHEVLNFYHDFFKPQAKEKNIDLVLAETPEENQRFIQTDKFIFDNILTNLLNNALKFTHHGYVKFGACVKETALIIYVKDSGIGIPKERKEAVFDRFVQANLDLTRAHEGSGLGLAIVKGYVNALGGKIWLDSEFGKGSTFTFSIPYIPALEMTQSKKSVGSALTPLNTKNLTILVAEDDNISYLFLEQILKDSGIRLIRSKSGKECVQLLKEHPEVALVLMDLKMPLLNGIEATKEIRKFNKDLPIIVQTAFDSSTDKKESIEAGANDYITKPIEKARLTQLIEKHVYTRS